MVSVNVSVMVSVMLSVSRYLVVQLLPKRCGGGLVYEPVSLEDLELGVKRAAVNTHPLAAVNTPLVRLARLVPLRLQAITHMAGWWRW